MCDSLVCIVEYVGDHYPQEDTVQKRCQNFSPIIPESLFVIIRSRGNPCCHKREDQRGGVIKHVPCVSQKSKTVSRIATYQFDDEKEQGYAQSYSKMFPTSVVAVMLMQSNTTQTSTWLVTIKLDSQVHAFY